MSEFTQTLQSWQFFFTAVATSAATLTGLLFVSLSLNRERLRGDAAHLTLSIARNTFGDFLYVLMIALVFLVPSQVPIGLSIALLVLGAVNGLAVMVRQLWQRRRAQRPATNLRWLMRQVGLPALASIGLIWVAVEISLDNYNAIFGLVLVIAALLTTACWNAWLLLVE